MRKPSAYDLTQLEPCPTHGARSGCSCPERPGVPQLYLGNPDPDAHPRSACQYPAGCTGCTIETPADACAELAGLAGWTTPADSADPFVVDLCWMNATANGRHVAAHMAGAHLPGPPAPWQPDRLELVRILAGGFVKAPTGDDLAVYLAGAACTVCGCTATSACEGGCSWRPGHGPEDRFAEPKGPARDAVVLVCTSCEVPA